MSRLKIIYFYGTEPYRLNGDLFDNNALYQLGERLRKQYADFADEINAQDGHISIYISLHNPPDKGFHYEVKIEGITENLRAKIRNSGVQ